MQLKVKDQLDIFYDIQEGYDDGLDSDGSMEGKMLFI